MKKLILLTSLLASFCAQGASDLNGQPPPHHSGHSSHQGVSECARRRLAWMQAISECGRIEDPHDRDVCIAAAGPDPGSCE